MVHLSWVDKAKDHNAYDVEDPLRCNAHSNIDEINAVHSNIDKRDNVPSYGRDNVPSYGSISAPQGQPPSYECLYGRIKTAKNESPGVLHFFTAFVIIIFSTIGVTIIRGILIGIPIAMLCMGLLHVSDCNAEPMIPIYLAIYGGLSTSLELGNCVRRYRKSTEEAESDQRRAKRAESLLCLFLFAFFITGSVYIYRTKVEFQSSDPTLPNYCDYHLYWFAFWITTAVYIIAAVSCCCVCSLGCLVSWFLILKEKENI